MRVKFTYKASCIKVLLVLSLLLCGTVNIYAQNYNDDEELEEIETIAAPVADTAINEAVVAAYADDDEDKNYNAKKRERLKKELEEIKKSEAPFVLNKLDTTAFKKEKSGEVFVYVDPALDNEKPEKKEKPEQNNKYKPKVDFSLEKDTQIVLGYIGVAIMLLLIFYALFGKKYFGSRDKKIIDDTVDGAWEDISTFSEWDKAINDAVAAGNYKLATRIMYLQTVQKMDNTGLITYGKDKSNSHYLSKIFSTNYYQPFKQLVKYYEYIWFGNYTVNADQFATIRGAFNNFLNQMVS